MVDLARATLDLLDVLRLLHLARMQLGTAEPGSHLGLLLVRIRAAIDCVEQVVSLLNYEDGLGHTTTT